MPNKTIYISDADIPLFERAQEIYGSNLSSTIVKVLRQTIEHRHGIREDEDEGGEYRDIIVEVGKNGCTIKQRFSGRLMAQWKTNVNDKIAQTVKLYETKNGRYALYTKSKTNWEHYDWNDWKSWKNYKKSDETEAGINKLEVFETPDEFRDRIPADISPIVEKKLQGITIEDLDI